MHRKIQCELKCQTSYLIVYCIVWRTYFIDWKNVFHIEVESKVNHVKNSVTGQGCSKAFVESLEAQTTGFNDLLSLNKARRLLHKLSKRRKRSSLQKENNKHSIISIPLTNSVANSCNFILSITIFAIFPFLWPYKNHNFNLKKTPPFSDCRIKWKQDLSTVKEQYCNRLPFNKRQKGRSCLIADRICLTTCTFDLFSNIPWYLELALLLLNILPFFLAAL